MSDMPIELKLEVVVLPVSDVDRAKRFYEGLGWRVDGDFPGAGDFRVVQMTPPGSPCFIHGTYPRVTFLIQINGASAAARYLGFNRRRP